MKLKSLVLSTLLLSSVTMADDMSVKQEGVKYIKMLGGTLKSELQAQMKADKSGMAAMGFCTAKANEITENINKKLPAHAKVRRTSLKVRNENNIKVVQNGDTTRVYKPLVAKAVCLKCHGTNISAEISKAIEISYPHDKAVGFKEGDLRGVVVAEIKKH